MAQSDLLPPPLPPVSSDEAGETSGVPATQPPARRSLLLRLLVPVLALGVIGLAIVALMPAPPAPNTIGAAGDEAPAIPRSGASAPKLQLTNLDGQPVALEDFRGQVVLVNFWATWCIPCRTELPDLREAYKERQDSGFTVLAIDVKESAGPVRTFLNEVPVPFPVLMDSEGHVVDRYAVTALPSSFFIDEDGIIRGVVVGSLNRAAMLKKLDQMAENRQRDLAAQGK